MKKIAAVTHSLPLLHNVGLFTVLLLTAFITGCSSAANSNSANKPAANNSNTANTNANSTANSSTTTAAKTPDMPMPEKVLSMSQVGDEFKKLKGKADAKLAVHGEVMSEVRISDNDDPSLAFGRVAIHDPKVYSISLGCVFPKADAAAFSNLKPGQIVVVQGTLDKEMSTAELVDIKNCQLVKIEP
jgi:uncharacterized protein YdeI (BOF family)